MIAVIGLAYLGGESSTSEQLNELTDAALDLRKLSPEQRQGIVLPVLEMPRHETVNESVLDRRGDIDFRTAEFYASAEDIRR